MDDGRDASLTEMLHTQMPLTATLGFGAVEGGRDRVVLVAAWDPGICTIGDAVHGGFLMALADAAGATCAFFNLPDGAFTTTIESKTNFFRAVRSGTITATAEPVHAGRTTVVVQTDLVDDDGRLLTRTTQTQAVIQPS